MPSCAESNIKLILCTVQLTNTSGSWARIWVGWHFYDAVGVRIDESRDYARYVAPGEKFITTAFGDERSARAEVVEIEIEPHIAPVTGEAIPDPSGFSDETLLPIDQAVVGIGPITESFIGSTVELSVINMGPVAGTLYSWGAWYDSNGIRLDDSGTLSRDVPVGQIVREQLYGPDGAVEFRVLEISLDPT